MEAVQVKPSEMEPIGSRYLVRLLPVEDDVTPSGLVLPDLRHDLVAELGVVEKVGAGFDTVNQPVVVQPGSVVQLAHNAGQRTRDNATGVWWSVVPAEMVLGYYPGASA